MKKRLLEPFRIGQMELRNRIVMAPMVTRYGNEKGYVTDRIKSYYEARARGGVALIIVEATYVHLSGKVFAGQLGIIDDSFIPGLSDLVEVIHKHGAAAALQLHHGGRIAKSELTGMQPVAPSSLANSDEDEVPKELTVDEIAEIINAFSQAAQRAQKAGFDGLEIHAAHGYLIDQFLSRSSNVRRDMYGGNLRNRARFLIELIEAVKRLLGKDYPIWCRINGREYGIHNGTTLADAKKTALVAQGAGSDAIHVSVSGPTSPVILSSTISRPAVIEHLAEGIKKTVTVPIIAVGRITPEAGEKILKDGKADLIAIGRGLLADPELPSKVASNRLEDIVPCLVCWGCLDDLYASTREGIRCHVNAALGREGQYKIAPATKPKSVLIVGGGPAGMETARVVASRGHCVMLYEKERRLGGQLNLAIIPPYKDRIKPLIVYLEAQIRRLGVQIKLGEEATAALIEQIKPDVLVLATGVTTFTPLISGLNKVCAVQAVDVLAGRVEVGRRVLVIGGEIVGCETAEFLADKGSIVTVTRRGLQMALGLGMGPLLREIFLNRLSSKGVTLLTGVTYNSMTSRGLLLTTREGETKTVEADTIVLAAGGLSNRKLYEELRGKVAEIHLVGDCVKPRTIRDAIADGFQLAMRI